MHLLALALAATLSAETAPAAPGPEHQPQAARVSLEDEGPLVPFYVPRAASFGFFVSNVPTFYGRVGWEVAFYERPRDHLTFFLDVGTGLPVSLPAELRALYQHVALAGVAYRSTRALLHWGFQFGGGALWYRATYPPGTRRFESRVVAWTEGRAELGLKLAPHVVAGLYVGYASAFDSSSNFPAVNYVGGLSLGLFANWR